MAARRFSHPDGGTYVIASTDPVQMKVESGAWEPAVLYRRVIPNGHGGWMYEGRNHFCTTLSRWNERFTEIVE